MKVCRHCDKNKKQSEYYRHSSTPDGLHYNCKECCKLINQASYLKKKESRTNYQRKRYAKTTTGAPPKKVRRKRNASGKRKYSIQHARRARELGLDADDTISVHELFKRDKGICQICKNRVGPSEASIDHIVPISKGGPHTWDNVQLSHESCNYKKGAKL